jgi:hypothetical protein
MPMNRVATLLGKAPSAWKKLSHWNMKMARKSATPSWMAIVAKETLEELRGCREQLRPRRYGMERLDQREIAEASSVVVPSAASACSRSRLGFRELFHALEAREGCGENVAHSSANHEQSRQDSQRNR